MALVTTKRNVDVLPGQAAPTVFHCSQHDVGATIILGLVNAGGNYSIPSGVTAIIQGSCSNGAVFTPVTATVSGSDITFNLSAEMTSIAGPTVCEAVLSKDTDVLGTANFILDVEESAMGSDTPPVFTDAAWLWMVDKMGSETVSALGDKTVIDAIEDKLDKNQGTTNAGKYLKVGADGNVEAAATDTTLSVSGDAADAKMVGDELDDLKADLNQTTRFLEDNTNVLALSSWANKRVTSDGLVNSPSQLTTEKIIYVGKNNILKFEAESYIRQVSISYYSIDANGDMTYIQSDVFRINYLKYIGAKYDFVRISFIGSLSDPPLLSEFSASLKHVQYNEFLGKNISFLGDSITTYRNISETSDSVNAPYYPTGDIAYPEQCYWKMFYDAASCANISVSAISNSSYRNQGLETCPSAYDTNRITRLSANGTPDYVFVNMGTNDPYSSNIGTDIGYTYDVETLESNVVYTSYGIQTTIRKIQTTYPNAKIILLIPKFASAINSGAYTFEKWERVCDYIKEIGNMYGVYKIIDLRKCGITVDTMGTDCIGGAMHPNYTGMKKMGAYLINELIQ